MTKQENKTSRANQTRSKSERPKVWVPPSSLDAPPAPDGFRYRWIRAESVGFQDTKNISSRLREGYELVRADEVENASDYPVVDDGQIQGGSWGRWPFTCEGTNRDCEATSGVYDRPS